MPAGREYILPSNSPESSVSGAGAPQKGNNCKFTQLHVLLIDFVSDTVCIMCNYIIKHEAIHFRPIAHQKTSNVTVDIFNGCTCGQVVV